MKKTVVVGVVHARAKPMAKTWIQPRCERPRTRMKNDMAKGKRGIGRRLIVRDVEGKRAVKLRIQANNVRGVEAAGETSLSGEMGLSDSFVLREDKSRFSTTVAEPFPVAPTVGKLSSGTW